MSSIVLAALCLFGSTPEESLAAAAKDIASQVAGAVTPGTKVVLAPTPTTHKGAADVITAVLSALGEAGVAIVDSAAVKAALDEATLSGDALDSAMQEMAAAAGAQVLLALDADSAAGQRVIMARAIEVSTGKVLVAASSTVADSGQSGATSKSLHAQLRLLSDMLAAGLDKIPGERRYQTFAVLPFDEVGATTKDKQLGLLVGSELTTLLQRDHNLMLVERSQLARVIDELSLGQSGLTDPEKTAQAGKLAGAQGLVIGTVSEVGDHYSVDARVVSVEGGEVMFATNVQLPAADLVALSSEAVVLRTRTGALYRSLLLPGWGQLYNRQGEKGAVFAGTEVAALALALVFQLQGQSYEKHYKKLDAKADPGDFTKTLDNAESSYNRRNIALIVAAGVHALNIVDALWFGRSFDSAVPSGSVGAALLGW